MDTYRAGWQITVPLVRAEYVVPGSEEFLDEMTEARKLVGRKGPSKAWDCILDGVDVLTDPQTLKVDVEKSKQYMSACLAALPAETLRSACEPPKPQQQKCSKLLAGTAAGQRKNCVFFGEIVTQECCKRGLCDKPAATARQVTAPQPPAKAKDEPRQSPAPAPATKEGTDVKKADPAVTPSPAAETKPEPKAEPLPEPEAEAKSEPPTKKAAAAAPTGGDSNLPDTLSRAEIQGGMRKIKDRVRDCYDSFHVLGTAFVSVTISPLGTINAAKVKGTFAGTPTGACLQTAALSATFPRFKGQAITIDYPFVLR